MNTVVRKFVSPTIEEEPAPVVAVLVTSNGGFHFVTDEREYQALQRAAVTHNSEEASKPVHSSPYVINIAFKV